jgi:excisionase family DNA binding protein
MADQLPEVLTAEDIAGYLRINVRRVYDNLNVRPHAGGIPNFKMGKQKRIHKQDFIAWMEGQKGVSK